MHNIGLLIQQHQIRILAGFDRTLPIKQTHFLCRILSQGRKDLFQRIGQPLEHILQRHILRQGRTGAGAVAGQLGIAVDDHHVIDTQMVIAVGQTRRHNGVGDGNDPV